nr:MAG TPA: hypothetical protein [Caudoviricetes sp.]
MRKNEKIVRFVLKSCTFRFRDYMRTDKKGFTRYEFYANGTGISARVELTLHPTNNSATAIISPNFNSKQLNLNGSISPMNKAYIYKGTSL